MIMDLVKIGSSLLDKIIPDPKARDEAKLKLLSLEQAGEFKDLEVRGRIVEAEAKSESWLTSNWRPMIMVMFGVIIANNYIIAPYLAVFGCPHTSLPIPPDLWALLKIGLGGYIVSRGAEKAVKEWRRA